MSSISPSLSDYPSGFVTIVFTDIVSSSHMTNVLNETERERYETALRNPHRDKLFACLNRHGGKEVHRAGDGHMCVFSTPQAAIDCMKEFQMELRDEPVRVTVEGEEFVVQVRVGIHTTERTVTPELREENGLTWIEYSGRDTNFAARISGLGGGEQILLSQSTYEKAKPEINQKNTFPWPQRYIKSFDEAPQPVHELLYYEGQEPREPGLRFFSAWYQDEKNRYIAREKEEQDVVNRFVKPVRGVRSRIVTIHAEGGMGKTRLAIACTLRMAGVFENAIHFVKLGETAPTKYAVAEAIGQVLGKKGSQTQPDALCASLRHEKMLLVLDNYESCASEEVAHFLSELASGSAGMHLLITGRQAVGVRNIEQLVPLNNGMTRTQARELFLERASLDGEHIEAPTDREEEQLARILRLISISPDKPQSGAIPLAVELAAAWWSEKSLKEIADGLEATPLKQYMAPVPGMVADDHTEAQGRHDSLERSLEWSFTLLGKVPDIGSRLQEIFALCGLFPDVFDHQIMQTIGGEANAETLLIRLHRASMLQKRDSGERTSYRLHHFSREYARQKLLELPFGNQFKRQFIAHYIRLVNSTTDLRKAENRALLDTEWLNVVAAAQWAIQEQDISALLTIVGQVTSFFQLRSLWSEWESLYLLTLKEVRKSNDAQNEGWLLNNLGIVYRAQGRWSEAEEVYEKSLVIYREFGDRLGEGNTLNNLGVIYQSQGLWSEAEEVYEKSLVIYREFGDRLGEAQTLNNLALLHEATNNIAGAIEFARQSVWAFESTQSIAELQKARDILAYLEAKARGEADSD